MIDNRCQIAFQQARPNRRQRHRVVLAQLPTERMRMTGHAEHHRGTQAINHKQIEIEENRKDHINKYENQVFEYAIPQIDPYGLKES